MTRTPAPTTASSVAPPPETASTGLAARLTSRWGARVAVLLFVLATILVSGAMRSAEVPPRGDAFPGSAESAVVAERLTHFPDAWRAPVLLVGTRDDGGRLTADDVAAMTALGDRPQRSEDGRAVVVTRDVTLGRDGSETAETVRAIRADVAACARYMLATCSGVVDMSGVLSSRIRTKRGKRSDTPRASIAPRAAV